MISRPSQDIMAHLWSILNQNHYSQSHSRSTSRSHLTSWSHLPKRAKLQFIFPGRSWSFKVSIFAIRHLPFTWRGALWLLILAGVRRLWIWKIIDSHAYIWNSKTCAPPFIVPKRPLSKFVCTWSSDMPIWNSWMSSNDQCLDRVLEIYWIDVIYFTAQELSCVWRYVPHISKSYMYKSHTSHIYLCICMFNKYAA